MSLNFDWLYFSISWFCLFFTFNKHVGCIKWSVTSSAVHFSYGHIAKMLTFFPNGSDMLLDYVAL